MYVDVRGSHFNIESNIREIVGNENRIKIIIKLIILLNS